MSSPTLASLVQSHTLNWIFVGGKGGVGKTTTSCALACLLASTDVPTSNNSNSAGAAGASPPAPLRRRKVLIISTDPAHNLSDAFNQKFSKNPTAVGGVPSLWAMEVDPSLVTQTDLFNEMGLDTSAASHGGTLTEEERSGLRQLAGVIKQAANTLPGIDEVTVFAEIIREIKTMHFDTVVFDTAPTGHTLRLLALPQTLNESVDRILEVQGLAGLINTAGQMVTNATGMTKDDFGPKLTRWRNQIKEVQAQFADHTKTTFVCVCIPEFLSVYETERLIQELMKYNIGCDNIVVNQLVMKPSSEPPCRMCESRKRIQGKYLAQIDELYEDFNVVKMPLLGNEVRGVEALQNFSKYLLTPYNPDVHGWL